MKNGVLNMSSLCKGNLFHVHRLLGTLAKVLDKLTVKSLSKSDQPLKLIHFGIACVDFSSIFTLLPRTLVNFNIAIDVYFNMGTNCTHI